MVAQIVKIVLVKVNNVYMIIFMILIIMVNALVAVLKMQFGKMINVNAQVIFFLIYRTKNVLNAMNLVYNVMDLKKIIVYLAQINIF